MRTVKLTTTTLHQSPFSILGVTIRDNRQHIVKLSEVRSLEIGHDVSQDARSALTNPRTRLSSEMSWLPGVSPNRANAYLKMLVDAPMYLRQELRIPTLAHLNLLSAAFDAIDENHDLDDLVDFILEFATLVDLVNVENVMRDVNEDRLVAGFPMIQNLTKVEDEFISMRHKYRKTIRDCINRFDFDNVIQIMTDLLEQATLSGIKHAPSLIDDLVDGYQSQTEGVLETEAEKIYSLIKITKIRVSSNSDERKVAPVIKRLANAAHHWDCIAQPIQLSAKARGINHDASKRIALSIRRLALHLINDHGMLEHARSLFLLLRKLFVELPEVSSILEKDVNAIVKIQAKRADAFRKVLQVTREMRARSIAYKCVAYNGKLEISVNGISWNEQTYSLEEISRVRWGKIDNSVYTNSTGVKYVVVFGSNTSESCVHFQEQRDFKIFTTKLRKAVHENIKRNIKKELRNGARLKFGDSYVFDNGVVLQRRSFLWLTESIKFSWSDIRVWTTNSAFHIASKNDQKTHCSLLYSEIENAYILAEIIQTKMKVAKFWKAKMSPSNGDR